MKISLILVFAASLIAQIAGQQTTENPVNSFLSEVYSVYTEVTSILASAAGATSTTSTSSSSTDSSSSSSSSSSTTSTSSTSGSSSSTSTTASSTSSSAAAGASASSSLPSSTYSSASSTGSAAAASSSAAAAAGHGSHPKILAIVLGTIFGILALILILLLILLCCRRRRRRTRRHRDVPSPEDDEIDSWRHERKAGVGETVSHGGLLGNRPNVEPSFAAAPAMTERSVHRPSGPENPFVPAVPPPRRTAPNSRGGLTDGAVPGQEPFVRDTKTGSSVGTANGIDNGDHHKGKAVAAGLGGAALGAATMHHHNQKKDEKLDRANEPPPVAGDSLDRGHSIARKPVASVPVSPIDARPFSPYMLTTVTPSETSASDQLSKRRSGDITRSGNLTQHQQLGNEFANDGFGIPSENMQQDPPQPTSVGKPPDDSSNSLSAFNSRHGSNSHEPLVAGAAGLGAGALAGSALARHHERQRSKSRSPQRRRSASYDAAKLGNRSSSSEVSSASYEDAMPAQPSDRLSNSRTGASMPTDIPQPPPMRRRSNSTLGTAAPAAALGSYQNVDISPLAQQSAQHHHDVPVPPLPTAVAAGAGALGGAALAHGRRNGNGNPSHSTGPANYRRRDQTPPSIPSRSPKRTRFSDVPFDEPLRHNINPNQPPAYGPPPAHANLSSPDEDSQSALPRGLVGGDRYPHMGLPSRRSGDDFDSIVPIRAAGPGQHGQPERESSDDSSTWRLSEGMPGGWRREKSRDRTRPVSGPPGGMMMRDSGIGSSSSGVDSDRGGAGSRSNSMTDGNGNGRRLRLADLHRETEIQNQTQNQDRDQARDQDEREMRDRGRKSMENEWVGNGGYDGYEYYHPMDGSFVGGAAPHAGGGDVGRAL